jgi:hypothetical protein
MREGEGKWRSMRYIGGDCMGLKLKRDLSKELYCSINPRFSITYV